MAETEFNHNEWVAAMVKHGHMTPEGETTYTPGEENAVEQPDLADRPAAEEEVARQELDGDLASDGPANGGVEVKYLGHGAYMAEGVEVRRNGQVVSVEEEMAQTLTGLQDDDGNALFERV